MRLSIERKGKRIIVGLVGVVFVAMLLIFYGMSLNNRDFTQQLGYKEKLENVIEKKNEELAMQAKNSEWFIVTKEMKENPKYQNPDGSVNDDKICEALGLSNTTTSEGALKEIYISAIDNHMEPHVLEMGEIAIYSDKNNKPWTLKKGDKVKFHIYVDTEYYNFVGTNYFGALKDEATF